MTDIEKALKHSIAGTKPPELIAPARPAGYVSREDYDRLARENFSKLKHIAVSPAHYRHNLMMPFEDTDAKKRGRACHLAVFEPERFRAEVVVWEDRRAGKAWEQFLDRHPDKEILTPGMYEVAIAAGKAARADAIAAPYLAGGAAETTVLWSHVSPSIGDLPGYSMDCKGRLDFVSSAGVIADLKTTKTAEPRAFGAECARLKYHVQAAWYVDGWKAMTGQELPYVIVAVEAVEPYVVTVFRVPPHLIELGRSIYREWLDTLAFCRRTNNYPAYAATEVDLELPRWAVPESPDSIEELDLNIG